MRKVILALVIATMSLATAHAQSGAQLGAGQMWGNSTGAAAPGKAENVTAILDRAMGSVNGMVLNRLGGTWVGTVSPTIAGTVTVNPAASTLAQGYVLGQTLPSGSAGLNNPYSANYWSIVNNGYQTPPGGTTDIMGNLPVVAGFRVDYQAAGSGAGQFPIQVGALFASKATSRGQQLVGLNGTTYTNIDSAGEDAFWAGISLANAGPSANVKALWGHDAEVGAETGAVVPIRFGVGATSIGPVTGSTLDAAFTATACCANVGTAAPWVNALVLYKSDTMAPVSGSIIVANTAFTMQYGLKLDNVTFANKIFDFGASVFQMDGSGNTTFAGNVTANSSIGLIKTANSPTVFSINNLSTGAAATASMSITNNLDQSAFGLAGSNYTTLSQLANRAYVHSGPANNGIILDAGGAKPIDFYVNNARVGGFTAGGALTLASGYPTTGLTGTLQAAQEPAHTGGCTNSAGSLALSCTNNTSIMGGGATNNILAGATGWVGVGLICNATESFCYLPQPQAGTISKLYVNVNAAPGVGQTYTVTMRKNATNQAITCQISGGSATSCNDVVNSFSVAAADNVSVQIAASGGATTVSVANFGFKLATTSP